MPNDNLAQILGAVTQRSNNNAAMNLLGQLESEPVRPESELLQDPRLGQLQRVSPERATEFTNQRAAIRAALKVEDDASEKAFFTDMRNVKLRLEAGDLTGAKSVLLNRRAALNQIPGAKADDVDRILNRLENEDFEGALTDLTLADNIAVQNQILPGAGENIKLGANDRLVSPTGVEIVGVERSPDGAPSGMASAVTKIIGGGSLVIQNLPSGEVVVKGADNQLITGQAAIDAIKEANKYDMEQGAVSAAESRAQTLAIERADEAFGTLSKIRENIATLDEAKQAVKDGADTGLLASKFPAFSEATRELRNVQKRLGLNVISSVTFGALSQGELDLALQTALPDDLEGPALIDWIERKQAAQGKLLNEMENLAIFLGTPGNTTADWINFQKDVSNSQQSPMESSPGEFPNISSQNERDALKPGDYYTFNGQIYRKR